jgi:hypothetical protein
VHFSVDSTLTRDILMAEETAVTTTKQTLRPDADTSHADARDMYDSYGYHASSEHHGDFMLQTVEYDWLDDNDDDNVIAKTIMALPDPRDDDDVDDLACVAADLVSRARGVRDDMEEIEAELAAAIKCYESGDVDGVIEHLDAASSLESDHGDDPAARTLRERLLRDTYTYAATDATPDETDHRYRRQIT